MELRKHVGDLTLRSLDDVLNKRASSLTNLTLLIQVSLPEDEYEQALPRFARLLSDGDLLRSAPRTMPLGFARMLTELAARCFVPRTSGSPRGSGLWQNLHYEIPSAQPGHVIGRAFEASVQNLRGRYPYLFWRKINGWRYVSNMLIHAGIPIQTVPMVAAALGPYLVQADEWAKRMDGQTIARALSGQIGLNKYTISVLSETIEGVKLVQQFLRLCHFIRTGGSPQATAFSRSFILAVEGVLQGRAAAPSIIPATAAKPFLIFDDFAQFIGWIVPDRSLSHMKFTLNVEERTETVNPEVLDTGRSGITADPKPTRLILQRSISGRSHTLYFNPVGFMLFNSRTGALVGETGTIPDEVVSGEYLVLAKRLPGHAIEERFRPDNGISITEENIPLPPRWRRDYQGFRIRFAPCDDLRVMLRKDRWVSLRVRRDESTAEGYITLGGPGSTYLRASHPAAPDIRLPVFSGEHFPEIQFWGEALAHNTPEVRLSRWTGDAWEIVRGVTGSIQPFGDGATLVLSGPGIEPLRDARTAAHLMRVSYFDLSYDPLDRDDEYFIWIPQARVLSQTGLLHPGSRARLVLQLQGDWRAATAVGTIKRDNAPRGTKIVHQLPEGVRRAQVKLQPQANPNAAFTLEWSSPGVAVGVLVPAEHSSQTEVPAARLPLESIQFEQLDELARLDVAWWPALTTALTVSGAEQTFLGDIAFDGRGQCAVHLLPLKPILRGETRNTTLPTVVLKVGNGAWPLFGVVSPEGLHGSSDGQDATAAGRNMLLWRGELLLNGLPNNRLTREGLHILGELAASSPHSIPSRFMLDRLTKRGPKT